MFTDMTLELLLAAGFFLLYKPGLGPGSASGAVLDSACNATRSSVCVQSLETFTRLDRLRFVETELELEALCRTSLEGSGCSTEFMKETTCLLAEDRLAFELQLNRSQAVFELLCKRYGAVLNPGFRKDYLLYAPCILKHEKRVAGCYYGAAMPMAQEPEAIVASVNSSRTIPEKYKVSCCPVERYADCIEREISATCGNPSANVLQTLVKKTAGQRLADFCSLLDGRYPDISQECYNSAPRWSSSEIILAFIVVVSYIL